MLHVASLRRATTRTKAVDDPLLNKLGLQVARTVAARAVRHTRSVKPSPETISFLDRLERDGFVMINDFLPESDFQRVMVAAESVLSNTSVPCSDHHHGSNELRVVERGDLPTKHRNDLDTFFAHPTVLGLAAGAARLPVALDMANCSVQDLTQRDGEPDREASIHSDTFYSIHKIWLYLTDVTEIDGPLTFYPGSHRLSRRLLSGIYRESIGENTGSRRIDPRELAERDPEPQVLTCPRNTLVLADTFGYHGRLQGRPPGRRKVLHMEIRPEPFRRR